YKLKDEFPEKFKEAQKIEEKRENNAALLPFTYNNGVTKFWYPPELETATKEVLTIKSSVSAIDRQLAELKKLEEEELKDEKPTLDKLDELSTKKKALEAKISEEQTKHSDEINAAETAKTTAETTLNAAKQKLASITGNTATAKRNRTAAEEEVSAATSKHNVAVAALAKAKESFAKLEEELTSVIEENEKLLGDEKVKYKKMREEEFKKKREGIVNALLNIKSGSPILAT
ncbi:MAG: hypothetical protein LBU35_01405, partial [Holosporales bacterium]|nr:hypothetical protein [Holosporales bacterium]